MAARRTKAEETPELDSLLGADNGTPDVNPDQVPSEPDTVDPDANPDNPQKPTENDDLTPEQREIARLRAELEAERTRQLVSPTNAQGRPLPDSALTPEQKEIRDLKDRLAKTKAANFTKSADAFDDIKNAVKVIHFVADGLTAQGRTWLTGQTLAFGEASYQQTLDRHGNSWTDLDEEGQWRRYGKVMFREGPWRGATYDDEVSREDARRGIAAPIISI